MRQRVTAAVLLAAITAAFGPAPVSAQGMAAAGGDFAPPGRPEFVAPLPLGNPGGTGSNGGSGFYAYTEFLIQSQTFALGKQRVAQRGLVDTTGAVTGAPGTFLGSGEVALTTGDFGKTSMQPGWRMGIGYKFDNGVAVFLQFNQMIDQTYSAGATLATRNGQNQADLANSYLYSPVFNFPPDYAGPLVKTGFDLFNATNAGGNFYGIWNGANVMDIKYQQRYTEALAGARVPLLQTEWSRVYGLGGGKFGWFFEKFTWRTVSADVIGRAFPSDTATYTNILSQRMYGPYIGCGHELYLGSRVAISADVTGALLASIVKERAYYQLGDKSTKAKRSLNEFDIVGNGNVDLNMWWYPIEGVQFRFGYSLEGFFGTRAMTEPIAFNFGQLAPGYGRQDFRYVSGFNIGLGLFF